MHPGAVIAEQFEIERIAGSGGMGTVYRAKDRHTGALIALKVLHGRGAQDADRFTREAQLLAGLSHPGIVRYVAHGVTPDGDRYLAIEWLEGESLADRLARAGLTVAETVTLAKRVTAALDVAHRRGIVHRDLKPNNLFVPGGELERIKILDFGIAHSRGGHRPITLTGALLGTPGYIAPEQARGERTLDARADVFSLGCVLFKCLSGRPAFLGDDVLAVLLKVALEEVPRLSELKDDIPEALDDLIARMMSKRPDDRPADAAAVSEALAALGPIARGRAAPLSHHPAALTTTERRVMCLVLARLGKARVYTEEKTLPSADVSARAEALREVARRMGGQLDFLADGSLVVGFAGSAGDQAARAARCALAMRELLADVPIVLVSGRGVVSARLPIGEVIERGVRLLAKGMGGGIRLDDVTAGLLDAQFDVGGDGEGLTLRAERDMAEATRTLLGKPTPCVGRQRELSALEGIFEECATEPVARAVVVIASAGVGKSRLRYEFLRRVHQREGPVQVWLARGDPMSAGSPFGMLGSAIRRAAGVLDGEAPEVRRQKLRARVGRQVRGDDKERVTEFIGELASVPFLGGGSVQLAAAREDPMLMGDQMRRAWEDWLSAECAIQPVLLVLEDLHWGDLPTVKFIDASLRNLDDRPFMVLVLARPEVDELFPKLWSGRPVTQMKLAELTRRASSELVTKALGDSIPEATLARVVERAGGNAFYLEELIRAVAAGQGDALPDTVLAVAQARLEAQAPEGRRVLRAASVFGQVFWMRAVVALLGGPAHAGELSEWLAELTAQEVITRRGKGKFEGEDEYVFRHALVREAAYVMLTDADRVLGHRLAASWLEKVGEGEAVVLAEHMERGGEPARAVTWYRRAAEQALGGNDFAAALTRVARGVVCGATGEALGQLRLLEAEARQWRGEHLEAEAAGLAAKDLLPRESPLWYGALKETASASGKLGHIDRLIEIAEEIEGTTPSEVSVIRALASASHAARQLFITGHYPRAERLFAWIERVAGAAAPESPAALASIHAARAIRALSGGDPAAFLEASDLAARAHEKAGDLRNACLERVNMGGVTMEVGRYAEAARVLREGLAIADPIGLTLVVAAAKCNLGLALARQGELEEGARLEAEACDHFVAQGERRMEGASRIYMAMILRLSGDLAGAEREARAAVRVLAVAAPARACALATLADALLAQGKAALASDAARQAMDLLLELGGIDEGESLARLTHAQALAATGDMDGARAAVASARERVLARAARVSDEALRESFLAIAENAATLALATEWKVP